MITLLNRVAIATVVLATGAFVAACGAVSSDSHEPSSQAACSLSGQWVDPSTRQVLNSRDVFSELAGKDIVLLGEQHTKSDHHLWQIQTIAGLNALHPEMVVGFEMFPRSVQPVLDQWSAGNLGKDAFLSQSRWSEVWGFSPHFYMPMFDLARINRIPMLALNVNRSLILEIGRNGWDSIPAQDREGVTDPAPASQSYRESLAEVFLAKKQFRGGNHSAVDKEQNSPDSLDELMATEQFKNFLQAQLAWDRAMAERLAVAKDNNPNALVVGVMGRGHIENRYGVPHQLADLGIDNVAVLIPVDAGAMCEAASPALADAVFVVDPSSNETQQPPKPRLGVVIEPTDAGIRVVRVSKNSIAEKAELVEGDIIVSAAEQRVRRSQELIDVIQRQSPGTWLPLEIQRGDELITIVAKFPAGDKADQ